MPTCIKNIYLTVGIKRREKKGSGGFKNMDTDLFG